MSNIKIHKKSGGTPIFVPVDVVELKISEPVSEFINLEKVIQSLPKLETLILYVTDYGKTDNTESLSFLRGAKQLKHLSLCSMSNLKSCAFLAECSNLVSLGLSRHVTKVFDFSVLPSLSSLRSLSVELPSNMILEWIAKASQLSSFQALGGFRLASLEVLAGLVNLESLKLWSGSLASCGGLAAFGKLETLNFGYSKIKDTIDLGSLRGLKKMELVGNKSITNLEFLRDGSLEYLGLFGVPKLDSIKPILRLSNLKEFRCEGNILDGDILPLVGVPTLQKAFIPGRFKAALKKIHVDCSCEFEVGNETLKLSKNGPLVLETASEATERLRKKLGQIP